MKLRLGILALMVALTACGSSAASSGRAASSSGTATSSSARHCGPAGATTLGSGSHARVYSWQGGVFGCVFAGGHSFRLGSANRSIRESRVSPVTLAGEDAAYGLSRYGIDTVRTDVVVRRLTDGKTLHEFPATARNVAEGFQSVASVAIKSDGAVAWIGALHSIIGGHSLAEVHAADASAASDRVLDSGSGIVATSLRLRGSTLSWKDGASTHHAILR